MRLLFLCSLAALSACQTATDRIQTVRDYPAYSNGGKPDLAIDTHRFASEIGIVERHFAPDDCAVQEGAVAAPGHRRLLRFDTVIFNAGDGDLLVGNRASPENQYANLFEYAACHGHYHIRGFSNYELLRADMRSVVVSGHKQGFCFRDNEDYRGEGGGGYHCAFQGITNGWADVYGKNLDGQWIDITGVPPGDYIVRVTINAAGSFDEGQNRYPNVAEVPVHIPPPGEKAAFQWPGSASLP